MYCSDRKYSALLYVLWIYVYAIKGLYGDVWHELTACYGSDNRCSQYDIQCPVGKTIVLGKMMYATKTDTNCQIGVSDCKENETLARCCTYDQSDKFTPFSAGNITALLDNCEGQNTCAGWAPRLNMFPYSSYVRIQYTCIDGTNAAEMCSNDRVVGNNLFLKLNGSSIVPPNGQGNTDSCNCLIKAPVCNSSITATFVDLEFQRPNLASVPISSMTSLQFHNSNASFDAINTQLYTIGQRINRMNQMVIDRNEEIISLKNLNKNEYGPDYLMIQFQTTNSPMILDCYERGKEAHFTKLCEYTTTPNAFSTTDIGSTTPEYHKTSQPTDGTSTTSYPDFPSSYHQTSHTTTQMHSSTNTEPISVDNTLLLPEHTTPTDQLSTDSSLTSDIPSTTESSMPSTSATFTSPRNSSSTPLSASTQLSVDHTQTSVHHTYPSVSSEHQTTSDATVNPAYAESTTDASLTDQSSTSVSSREPKSNTSSEETVTPTKSVTSSDKTTSLGSRETTLGEYNVNSSGSEHNVVVGEPTKSPTGAVISVTNRQPPTTKTTKDDDVDTGTSGLIIGITVAVVVVVLVIVGVLVACFCIRLKQKETIRRNYIRNTNIFYSFPEDFNDTGSIKSGSPEVGRSNQAFVSTSNDLLYATTDNEAKRDPAASQNGTLRLDTYKIKHTSQHYTPNIYNTDPTYSYGMPNDNSYTSETSNETIDFVNGRESVDVHTDNQGTVQNGIKSVTFDPSALYAKVNKEGKTKF